MVCLCWGYILCIHHCDCHILDNGSILLLTISSTTDLVFFFFFFFFLFHCMLLSSLLSGNHHRSSASETAVAPRSIVSSSQLPILSHYPNQTRFVFRYCLFLLYTFTVPSLSVVVATRAWACLYLSPPFLPPVFSFPLPLSHHFFFLYQLTSLASSFLLFFFSVNFLLLSKTVCCLQINFLFRFFTLSGVLSAPWQISVFNLVLTASFLPSSFSSALSVLLGLCLPKSCVLFA